MQEIQSCLLCGSDETTQLRIASTKELIGLYKKIVGNEIEQEIPAGEELVLHTCNNCDLRFFTPTITGSERFYELLQEIDWYYLEEKTEYSIASKYIKGCDKVLEIGSGKGSFSKIISTNHYTGLEVSENAIQMAKNEGVNITKETIETHAQDNVELYDIVCSFQVLEHVANASNFLSYATQCIKPGGLLILSVPSADSFVSMGINNMLNLPPHHVTWWTDKALSNIEKFFNLELVSIHHEPLQDIHKQWYSQIISISALCNILGYKPHPVIDRRFGFLVISKLGKYISLFIRNGLRDERILPNGHSVISIYKKS